jgi:integrase
VAADVGLAAGVGAYSLRHTFITHALLKNTPVRVVAEMCDTSVKEIEATYGAAISDHADAVARAAIPDFGDLSPADKAVVPLRR